MIKFFDIQRIQQNYTGEIIEAVNAVIKSGHYILGPQLEAFEREYSEFMSCKYSLGVSSGLDALRLILRGMIESGRLNRGDEVIVPANTFIATILAITDNQLVPKLIEPDIKTYNIDPETIRQAIDSRTKLIMPVHLYGRCCEMDRVMAIAGEHGIPVVEDAAQAHGAKCKGKMAGNFGLASGFSFYPAKNLGALGDGGMICTNDQSFADLIGSLRNYGSPAKYIFDHKGYNCRLDEIQAAALRIKLKYLADGNLARKNIARKYCRLITNPRITLPEFPEDESHVWHLFVIRTPERDKLQKYLDGKGIGTIIHYPVAPHRQKALPELHHYQLPVTEQIHDQVLSIPLHPALTQDETDRIAEVLNAYPG